ncbi:MAG: VWA domain-containing protein [Gemmatimonadaceae bacterium]|nr:VWA domain-containing protein [Gemmatimonadaceae bacterium]
MTFLSPLALLLAAAVAVPLVLHLLRRKTGEQVEFPALRYLLRAQREFSRTLKLRNLLLMLIRVAAVLAIALAAARPVGRMVGGGHPPTALAVVLDNSLSTSAVVAGRPVLALLKDAARQALGRASAGDRVWLVTADGRVVGGDAGAVRDAVDRTETFAGAGDLPGATARAAQLVQASGIPSRQVAVLTDGQASAWQRPVAMGGVSTTVFAPAGAPPRNRAVVRAVPEPPHWTPRGAVRASISAPDSATFRVLLGGHPVARGTAAPGAEVEVRLQPSERGWLSGSVELEPDELRGDDVRWFAAHVGPPPSVVADQSAGAFARTAVDALAQEGRVTRGNDVVIAGAEAARRPAVLFAPADPVQLGAANRALQRAGVPWRLGAERKGPAPVRGPGLDGVTATLWYALDPVAAAGGAAPADTLAHAGGDAWAVAGDGYVLVASPLQPAATDLPIRAGWLPWLGAAIADRLGGEAGAVTEAAPGAPITRPSWARELEWPDGAVRAVIEPRPRAPARAGVYFWRRGTARGSALVVNPEVAESDLSRLAVAQLQAQFAGGPVEVSSAESEWLPTVFAVGGRRALEGTLLAVAALLLITEAAVTRAPRDTAGDTD